MWRCQDKLLGKGKKKNKKEKSPAEMKRARAGLQRRNGFAWHNNTPESRGV